jgi:hypothetical protein
VPLQARRGGPRPLSEERSVSLLACRIYISTDCDRLAAFLDLVLPRPAQRYPISRRHHFAVRREGEGYRIEEDGVARAVEPTLESAGYALTARMHALALAALPEFTKVHAGCASWKGRRLLAVGPPHAGKTTLMIRLLSEGFTVYGDELTLVKNGEALPYPRRFGVRPPTVALIPSLAGVGGGGDAVLVTDPAQLGSKWVIEPGPVASVFYLEPNHDGHTRLEPCAKYLMVQRVMSQSTAPQAGRQQWIRDICDMLDRASTFTVRLGNLDEAVSALKDVLRRTPAVAVDPATETV